MRIVFCGTGEIGAPTLQALMESRSHQVIAVITQPDKPAGRDLKPRASAIKQLALAHGILVYQPQRLRSDDAVAALRDLRPDVMIVAAYGQILPKRILQIPSHGCLNLHASLLPRHRGASPIQAAILDDDAETGITVMQMDEGLDTGDIILMEALPIGAEETAGNLHDRLAALAAPCLARALQQIEDGSIRRIPQDNTLATYAPKLRKADGWLDWSKPAAVLERRVRGMSPWPGAFARLGGHILKIHEAVIGSGAGAPGEVLASEPGELKVAAGEGCLILNSIQLEGRKRLSASEFLRGFPIPAGARFDLSFSHPD